ncbi:SurA N-terminal domain-containing protein [Sessilibacter corallicola]|uniref:Periplasmic chaperone PpiD n=1 Tax=Sessilibacter corallicola TaxID=2904075 RepID=A0ABQ0AA31_9GAMM
MLQSFRDNLKGTVAIILVGLICIPFALFGIESLFTQNPTTQPVAEVNGEPITRIELDQAVQIQKRQLIAQLGDNLPPEFLSDERLRQPVLESLIQRKALIQAADKSGLAASEQQLNSIIVDSPDFKIDGEFDNNRFIQALRTTGYTVSGYKSLLSEEVTLNQFSVAVGQTNFALKQEVDFLTALGLQTRDFDYVLLKRDDFLASVEASDEEIQAYYDENQLNYLSPETITIEAIELNAQDLVADFEVDEETLLAEYDIEIATYQATTQRRASHILLDPSLDTYNDTLDTIQSRLDAGEEFSVLAKEFSQDFGSKENGGDVGYTSGESFVSEFEDALLELEVGQVSSPVLTDFGIHIIKLTAIEDKPAPTFEEMRFELVQRLKQTEAEARFIDKSEALADLSFNVSDLSTVAEDLELTLWTSEPFTSAGGVGLAGNAEIVNAAFNEELIGSGRSSDIISLGDDSSVVIRVTSHTPEAVMPLEDVKDSVAESVKQSKASELLAQQSEEVLAKIKSGEDFSELATAMEYKLEEARDIQRQNVELSRELVEGVFGLAKPADAPIVDKVELTSGDIALVSLSSVKAGDLTSVSEQELAAVNAQLGQAFGNSDLTNIRQAIVAAANVE